MFLPPLYFVSPLPPNTVNTWKNLLYDYIREIIEKFINTDTLNANKMPLVFFFTFNGIKALIHTSKKRN
ncbi:hypothetical protein BD770DRAFT_402739 [Pilaira anomala]|nr:hypothetical protein BD770DRAFT_402739 [Pilaira anomala]